MNYSLIKIGIVFLGGVLLMSCATLKETARFEFIDDEYWYRQRGNEYQKANEQRHQKVEERYRQAQISGFAVFLAHRSAPR